MLNLKRAEKQKQICSLIFDILKDYDGDFIKYDYNQERLAKNEINTLIKDKIDFKSSYDFNLHYEFADYSFLYCYNTKEEFEKDTGLNYSDIAECRIYFTLKNILNIEELINLVNFANTSQVKTRINEMKKYSYCFNVIDLELNEIEKIIKYILDIYYQENKNNG